MVKTQTQMKKNTMKKMYCPFVLVIAYTLVFDLFATEPRPNIIIIKTDELRWDALGYAGNTVVKTPNIKNGIVTFSQTSPAKELGIKPIDVSSAGVINDN